MASSWGRPCRTAVAGSACALPIASVAPNKPANPHPTPTHVKHPPQKKTEFDDDESSGHRCICSPFFGHQGDTCEDLSTQSVILSIVMAVVGLYTCVGGEGVAVVVVVLSHHTVMRCAAHAPASPCSLTLCVTQMMTHPAPPTLTSRSHMRPTALV